MFGGQISFFLEKKEERGRKGIGRERKQRSKKDFLDVFCNFVKKKKRKKKNKKKSKMGTKPDPSISAAISRLTRVGPYHVGKALGSGCTGEVKLATHADTGHQVAIKIIRFFFVFFVFCFSVFLFFGCFFWLLVGIGWFLFREVLCQNRMKENNPKYSS